VSEEISLLQHRCTPGENSCNLDVHRARHFYMSRVLANANQTEEAPLLTSYYYVVVVRDLAADETIAADHSKRTF
jgi:hypothetical protein